MARVPAIDLSRSRDLGDLFNDTFSLYRRYFGLFAGIAFAVVVPMNLVLFALHGAAPRAIFTMAAVLAPWLIGVPLITAGHVQAVKTLGERRDVLAGDSLRAALRRLPAVTGTVLLYSLITLLGFVCLILPGIFLAVRLYFSAQVVMAEGLGPSEAISRSSALTEGSFWRVLGIGILLSLVAGVMGAIAGAPLQIAGAAADAGVLTAIGGTLQNGISLSFTALSGTLLYFDLRARHHGAPEPRLQYPAFPPDDLLQPERP
jgi:hypothetical protein